MKENENTLLFSVEKRLQDTPIEILAKDQTFLADVLKLSSISAQIDLEIERLKIASKRYHDVLSPIIKQLSQLTGIKRKKEK